MIAWNEPGNGTGLQQFLLSAVSGYTGSAQYYCKSAFPKKGIMIRKVELPNELIHSFFIKSAELFDQGLSGDKIELEVKRTQHQNFYGFS